MRPRLALRMGILETNNEWQKKLPEKNLVCWKVVLKVIGGFLLAIAIFRQQKGNRLNFEILQMNVENVLFGAHLEIM